MHASFNYMKLCFFSKVFKDCTSDLSRIQVACRMWEATMFTTTPPTLPCLWNLGVLSHTVSPFTALLRRATVL